MVLVLIFLIVVIIVSVLIILITTMFLELEIRNFKLCKVKKQKIQLNNNYKAIIYFSIFKCQRIFKISINLKKMQTYYNKKKVKNMIFPLFKSIFFINSPKNIEIAKLKLNLKIGTENSILTSGAVTIFNTIFPVFISKYITHYSNKRYRYIIMPIYNENIVDLFLECNIKIKIMHILKILKVYIASRKQLILK